MDALEKGLPADGGPAVKHKADIRLNQVVTRVQLAEKGVAVHVEGQARDYANALPGILNVLSSHACTAIEGAMINCYREQREQRHSRMRFTWLTRMFFGILSRWIILVHKRVRCAQLHSQQN